MPTDGTDVKVGPGRQRFLLAGVGGIGLWLVLIKVLWDWVAHLPSGHQSLVSAVDPCDRGQQLGPTQPWPGRGHNSSSEG